MKIKKNIYDYTINILNLICLLITTLYIAVTWKNIPELLPGHYSAGGVIDRMANKSELIVLLAIGWGLVISVLVINEIPKWWNIPVLITKSNKKKVYQVTRYLIETIALLISMIFSFLSLHTLSGNNLPSFFTPFYLSVFLGVMIFFVIWLYRIR